MKVLEKRSQIRPVKYGRLSDGSDATIVAETVWHLQVLADGGRIHDLQFDHDPTADEVLAALPVPQDVVSNTFAGRRELLIEAVQQWAVLSDFATAVIADAGATVQQKTRAQTMRDNAYNRAKNLLGGS